LFKSPTSRIQTVANLIPHGTRVVVDVGYDHGRLIALLAQQRPDIRVIGVERQPDAAERFWRRNRLPPEARDRILLLCGDGFEVLGHQTPEVAVLSGLGERRILDAAPQAVARLNRLVMAPLGNRALLRPYLRTRSWTVVEERLLTQHNRYYQVFAACPACPSDTAADPETWLFGTGLFEQRHPLLAAYLRQLARQLEPMVSHADEKSHDLREFCSRLGPAVELAEARCRQRAGGEGRSDVKLEFGGGPSEGACG